MGLGTTIATIAPDGWHSNTPFMYHYRQARARIHPAAASEYAVHALMDGLATKPYYKSDPGPQAGAVFKSGSRRMRWVERPALGGLRFVATCSEGWYTDDDGLGDLAYGVVWSIPGRRGFLAGYTLMGEPSRRGPDRRLRTYVAAEDAAACFEWEIIPFDRGYEDALRVANWLAEKAADDEREYRNALCDECGNVRRWEKDSQLCGECKAKQEDDDDHSDH